LVEDGQQMTHDLKILRQGGGFIYAQCHVTHQDWLVKDEELNILAVKLNIPQFVKDIIRQPDFGGLTYHRNQEGVGELAVYYSGLSSV